MRSQPRISIGVPVYNGERFIVETIDSLLSQTLEEFELIIVDNASTDRTPDICSCVRGAGQTGPVHSE